MTEEEKTRLIRIAYQSKKGLGMSDDDREFVRLLYDKYPDEYGSVHKIGADRAVGEINPFGT